LSSSVFIERPAKDTPYAGPTAFRRASGSPPKETLPSGIVVPPGERASAPSTPDRS